MKVQYSADTKRVQGEPVLAVIYARYSSHSQTEQSIEGQLSKGREYAAAKGYTVVGEYADRAMTGRNDNRAEFQRMLADTDKRAFDVIIVWKVDRFGRNREEIAFNKHRCKKNGIKLEYVAETLTDSPESIILESVLEGMAEYYSVQLAANVTRGIVESAKKGQHTGGRPSLGYRVNRETLKLEIEPETAPIVQLAFQRYAAGATVTEIIKEFNEKGFKTRTKKPFVKNSLYKMLSNERYIGTYLFHGGEIRIENAIPPLVDVETYTRVQELLRINKRAPAHTWSRSEYLLTDKLFCGKCGSLMVGECGTSKTGAKHDYYLCTKHKREHACDKRAVRRDWIEPLVLREIHAILNDDTLLNFIADKTWEYYQAQDDTRREREALQQQLDAVENATNNLLHAIEMGIFNAATKKRMDDLDAQKSNLTAALAELEIANQTRLTRDHILFFLQQFRDMRDSDRECQKRLISTFVNAIYVYDDKLTITFNYSGGTSAVSLGKIEAAEAAQGFVCCLPSSTRTHSRTAEVVRLCFLFQKAARLTRSRGCGPLTGGLFDRPMEKRR